MPAAPGEEEHEVPLQAILLTDPHTADGPPGLAPAHLDAPPALLPLNNVAAIDYVLEWLAGAGAKEVLVCSRNHGDQIAAHLQRSPWRASLTLRSFHDPTLRSPGDVLRDLDARAIVRSDPFLVVGSDVLTSADLAGALAAHAARRRTADPAAVMTAVLRP
eukprot:CAMPEP_0194293660 /NCGR_PEP_ID=MMETSP0169-20130528/48381_1 /TAXON_ID=218684 /ORGANISM="Corethron pennatum, Strain L29A3" /LENGTH=160 /DNA_ID=CAMNT_0039042243 /DNA_START=36 /DNA_END=515 /DNA_ORIENTATION=-